MQHFTIRGSATPRTTFLARGSEPPRTPFTVEGPGGRHYAITEFKEHTPIDHHDRNDRQFAFYVGDHQDELPSIGTLTVMTPLLRATSSVRPPERTAALPTRPCGSRGAGR